MAKFYDGGSSNINYEDALKFNNGDTNSYINWAEFDTSDNNNNINWEYVSKIDNGNSMSNINQANVPKFDNGGINDNINLENTLKFDNGGRNSNINLEEIPKFHDGGIIGNMNWEDVPKFNSGGISSHFTWEDVLKFNIGGRSTNNITWEHALKFDNGGNSSNSITWEDAKWTDLFQYTNADTQASLMLPAVAAQHHQPLSHGVTKNESDQVEFPTHLLAVPPVHNGSSSVSVPLQAPWTVQQNNTWEQIQRTPQFNNGAFLNVHEHSLNPAAQVLPTLPAGFTQNYQPLAQIESGQVALPAHPVDVPAQNGDSSSVIRRVRAQRKTWTLEEHLLFLYGLKKYGKGNWKDISRYVVKTRTLSQVASHAQKYFERQNIPKEERKRKSIHDITVEDELFSLIFPQNSTLDEGLPIQNLPEMQPPQQQMLEWNPPNNMQASTDEWNGMIWEDCD